MALGERRLVVVLGKGGVGRTTVAAALGLAAAAHGRETLVAEVASQSRLRDLFDLPRERNPEVAGAETSLGPRLHGLSVDPVRALEEYLHLQLPLAALARRLAAEHAFAHLAAAAPGLRELVTIGKLWWLLQDKAERAAPYELVVADLPATGHGLAMLRSPTTFSDIAATGPLHRHTMRIAHDLHDPRVTAAVVVARPQELPVNEALALTRGLDELRMPPALAVANAVPRELVASGAAPELERVAAAAGSPLVAAAAAAGADRARADTARAEQIARLRIVAPEMVVLPELDEVDRQGLEALADELGDAWL